MSGPFECVLFEHEPIAVRNAVRAGLSTFMIDTEWRGKSGRQCGWDTEIAPVPLAAIGPVAATRGAVPWCRINGPGPWNAEEIDACIAAGATRVFLPMVRTAAEVEAFIAALDGRAEVAILVETPEALGILTELAQLPLAAVYVGLNDLAIGRGSGSIFDAVLDGTVARVRDALPEVDFGFAGVTVVDGGAPVPASLLLAEMERLDATFGFLRRSFRRDIRDRDMTSELRRLQAYWIALGRRSAVERAADHEALLDCLRHETC